MGHTQAKAGKRNQEILLSRNVRAYASLLEKIHKGMNSINQNSKRKKLRDREINYV